MRADADLGDNLRRSGLGAGDAHGGQKEDDNEALHDYCRMVLDTTEW